MKSVFYYLFKHKVFKRTKQLNTYKAEKEHAIQLILQYLNNIDTLNDILNDTDIHLSPAYNLREDFLNQIKLAKKEITRLRRKYKITKWNRQNLNKQKK